MADDFVKAVDDGLRLSKRIYFGKDRSVAPPKPMSAMDKSSHFSLLPPSPMLYAIISDPAIVDNPDIPSYQPHVHGRCDPPALIPLQMNGIELEANCYLDTAILTVTASWRVHCVMGSRCCDCLVAIPMGQEGSILGIEINAPRKSYSSKLAAMEDRKDVDKTTAKAENGSFLKSHIFTFTVPQVDGGSNVSLKVSWLQKLSFCDGQFSLCLPFSFPEYVTPAGKKVSKKEKIELFVDAGPETEVLCKTTSHPLKERRRQAGKLYFVYEADVLSWSSNDFIFSYAVSSSHVYGNVLLHSPSTLDPDQRDMFCFYLFPGSQSRLKVFRKEVIFAVDISGSMRGKLLDDVKSALCAALLDLDPEDSFNIIAFNADTFLFSSKMEKATMEVIENATQWINVNFIVGDGTNISQSINQALEILSNTHNSIPMIFLVTDGAVEDERQICDYVKSQLTNRTICPRIYTFGIGTFCNHYFLRMLATIGRGDHDAAYDADSVDVQLKAFIVRSSSTLLANVTIDDLDGLDNFEVYPSRIPDLLSQKPLIVSGRYKGTFPIALKARGVFPDMSDFTLDLAVHQSTDIPFDKILGKRQIDLLTAQAWFSENKQLEETVAKISVHSGCQSEFTSLILFEMVTVPEVTGKKQQKTSAKNEVEKMTILLRSLGVGYGSLTATMENRRPGVEEDKLPEAAEKLMKAACNCCGKLCNRCCCLCCIQACSQVNDQCAIVLTQFCGALACLGCFACCELCCGDE